jgi:hypothetical protein
MCVTACHSPSLPLALPVDAPVIPYPDWFKWGDNMKFEHEHGVVGYYGEGNAMQLPGRDLAELTIYLQARRCNSRLNWAMILMGGICTELRGFLRPS